MEKQIYKQFISKKKLLIIFLVGLIGIGVGLDALNPFLFGQIIDVIVSNEVKEFGYWIVLLAILLIVIQIVGMTEGLVGQWLVSSCENDMKVKYMKRILQIRNKEIEKYENGELLNRLEFDTEVIVNYYIDLISSILMIVINLSVSLYFIFFISLKLSAIAFIFFPLIFLVNISFKGMIRKVGKSQKELNDCYYNYLNMIFSHLNPIKAFQIQNQISETFRQFLKRKLYIEIKGSCLSSFASALRGILTAAMSVTLLVIAGRSIMQGIMTVGSLVAFNSYLEKLSEAVGKILELNLNRQNVFVSFERLEELENMVLESEMEGKEEIGERISALLFENVHFSYGEYPALNGLSFSLREPGLYSFVGENGCGKTTLLKVVERFWDVDSGHVIINGKDIRSYCLDSLRSRCVYIAKEVFFIQDTVFQNLRISRVGVTEAEMIEACKKTGIHEKIMELPNKYETVIEGDGKNFSSGQKQKLSFARVLLAEAELILLDEVTSDLDKVSEIQICDLIEEISESAIVINVSHKPESIKRSKEVFTMEAGAIVR